MSAQWDQQYKDGQGRYFPNEELVRFLGRTYGPMTSERGSGSTAIEIGCGVGGNIRALAEWGFFTYGLECSREALRLAILYASKHGFKEHVEYRHYVAPEAITLPAKSAQLVLDIQTLQHLDMDAHADTYQEVYRLLVPGGVFFSVHWCGAPEAVEKIFPSHQELKLQRQALFDVPAMLMGCGFRVPYCETVEKTYPQSDKPGRWAIIEAVKP